MGWLTELTDWIARQVHTVFEAFTNFMQEFLLMLVEAQFTLWLTVLNNIPVPDFVKQYTVGGLLSNIGGDLLWFVGQLRIGEGLGLLGAGYAARLVRKALTLGQW